MTTINAAVHKATEVFVSCLGSGAAETVEREAEVLFDAASAVLKLLAPFVSPVEADEDEGYDIVVDLDD